MTLHDIEITRAGRTSGGRGRAASPSDELTLNLTAKTYRYLDEEETAPAADEGKDKKKGGRAKRKTKT